MTDKLAEEILDNLELDGDWQIGDIYFKHEVIRAMQAYHEAKMKEVTDADIEHKADDVANCESSKEFERGEWLGFKEGARAFRDGLIKHKDNG